MKFLIAIFVLVSIGSIHGIQSRCNCSTAAADEFTRRGGNHWIVNKPSGTYRFVSGEVVMWDDGKHMDDSLVELFTEPDYLLCDFEPNNPNKCSTYPPAEQHRVGACKTGIGGRFCFSDIPSGKYELRVSKGVEWNVVHFYVVVDSTNRRSKNGGMAVKMTLGD
jgi:hypothetical protein